MQFYLLLCMIFMHIVDDYYLQGILASMKCRSWWKSNAPEKMYENDYKMALIMHAFSWTYMIMIPAVVYLLMNGKTIEPIFAGWFSTNMIIHAFVDNAKANDKKINLCADQTIHLIQIVVTWLFVLYEVSV